MFLRWIELRNFRNFEGLSIKPSPEANCLVGPNGSGKTNIAEAIYLLALAKSWRTKNTFPLIKNGEAFATVSAEVVEGQSVRRIDIILQKDARRVLLDAKPIKKLSELNSVANVLLFTPDDVGLFKGPPNRRRSFLDVVISKRDAKYFDAVMRYSKLLEDRNSALKGERPNSDLIKTLTEQMVAESAFIVAARSEFIRETNEILRNVASSLYGPNETLELAYRPFVQGPNFEENALKAYEDAYESDLIHRSTSIGVHREDFSTYLNGKDISLYGSQGQNRLAAIALKISPAFLPQETAKKPIVVLDDVMGELDDWHSKALLNTISGIGQTFITSTNAKIPGAAVTALGD